MKDSSAIENYSGKDLVANLRQQIPDIGRELGEKVPISASSPITMQELRDRFEGEESDIYMILRYMYQWAVEKQRANPPEGYESWVEYNKQTLDTFRGELTKLSFLTSDIRYTQSSYPQDSGASIYIDNKMPLVTAFGEEYPYFLMYDDADWDLRYNSNKTARVYITLDTGNSSSELTNAMFTFPMLCDKLRLAGIQFVAKSSSPSGYANAADNIILYFNAEQSDQLREVLRAFDFKGKVADQSQVKAAVPDAELPGVAWGVQPGGEMLRKLKFLTGKTEGSYSLIVAMYGLQNFLERLASAHLRLGNEDEADYFHRLERKTNTYLK